jgi:2-polyprenyl-3-methyl-5-hydroxy-6-metoxy-1,4-benzoquinol methylase
MATCSACGLLFREQVASQQERTYWNGYLEEAREQRYDRLRQPFYRDFWRMIKRWPQSKSAKPVILDVGCVPGMLLAEARKTGWDLHGVEMTAELCERTHEHCGARMWEGRLEQIDFGRQRFDLIVLSDVFRHLNDPHQALRQCAAILRPRGAVVIRDINIGHAKHAQRLMRPYPFDMQFLTPKHASRFLKDAGFASVQIHASPASLLTNRHGWRLAVNHAGVYRAMQALVNGVIWSLDGLGGPAWARTPSFIAAGWKQDSCEMDPSGGGA